MTNIFGTALYIAGMVSMAGVTYSAIAFRSFGAMNAPNSLVWPFYAAGLLIVILMCEAGRPSMSQNQSLLMKVQFAFLAINVALYFISGFIA